MNWSFSNLPTFLGRNLLTYWNFWISVTNEFQEPVSIPQLISRNNTENSPFTILYCRSALLNATGLTSHIFEEFGFFEKCRDASATRRIFFTIIHETLQPVNPAVEFGSETPSRPFPVRRRDSSCADHRLIPGRVSHREPPPPATVVQCAVRIYPAGVRPFISLL